MNSPYSGSPRPKLVWGVGVGGEGPILAESLNDHNSEMCHKRQTTYRGAIHVMRSMCRESHGSWRGKVADGRF